MTLKDFSILSKKVFISVLVFAIPLTILKGGILLVELFLK